MTGKKVATKKKEVVRGRNSGKSKSLENPNGIRRKDFVTEEFLAPRSIRKKAGKRTLLKDCSKKALEKANVKGIDE